MKKLLSILAVSVFAFAANAGTLDDVKNRGFLKCGVTTGLAGFAAPDDSGEWAGLDADMCRAVAVAVFGDRSKVEFITTTGKSRFPTLASGEVDMLARNTTWTISRDVNLGFEFVGVNFYDGQGFMIPSSLGVSSATELDGATVCIQTGTTTELNLADFFRLNGISYEALPIETNDEGKENLFAGRCDVYTTDASIVMEGALAEISFPTESIPMIVPKYTTLFFRFKPVTVTVSSEPVACRGAMSLPPSDKPIITS